MKVLVNLLQQSVLITGTIALLTITTACSLWWRGLPVPQDLYFVLGIVLAFFFGSKSEQRAGVIIAETLQAIEAQKKGAK